MNLWFTVEVLRIRYICIGSRLLISIVHIACVVFGVLGCSCQVISRNLTSHAFHQMNPEALSFNPKGVLLGRGNDEHANTSGVLELRDALVPRERQAGVADQCVTPEALARLDSACVTPVPPEHMSLTSAVDSLDFYLLPNRGCCGGSPAQRDQGSTRCAISAEAQFANVMEGEQARTANQLERSKQSVIAEQGVCVARYGQQQPNIRKTASKRNVTLLLHHQIPLKFSNR